MPEQLVQPWIDVRNYMEPSYREVVVKSALHHFPRASDDLHAFTKRALNKRVKVQGPTAARSPRPPRSDSGPGSQPSQPAPGLRLSARPLPQGYSGPRRRRSEVRQAA